MSINGAIKITLYSGGDEKKDEFRRLIVPWGFLKRAVRLSKSLGDGQEIEEEQLDEISDLLVEFFGGQFTRAELEAGADVSEILACFKSIVSKAQGLLPNAPAPVKLKK
jgi:hypothetical protein